MTAPSQPLYLNFPESNIEEFVSAIITKICIKCGIEKPLNDFYKNKHYKDGYDNRCTLCLNAQRRKYRREGPKRIVFTDTTRTCTKCGIDKPWDAFHKDKHAFNGHSSICKQCKLAYPRRMTKQPPLHKICHREGCEYGGSPQPIANFHKEKRSLDGFATQCRSCKNKVSGEWRKHNPEKHKAGVKKSRLKRKREHPEIFTQEYYRNLYEKRKARGPLYTTEDLVRLNFKKFGVDQAWYDCTLAAQGGRCAICRIDNNAPFEHFCIDHNHKCCGHKKACDKCRRGLLCHKCNIGLGFVEHNDGWIDKSAAYLMLFGTVFKD